MRLLMTTDTVGGVWTFTQELVTGLLERGCAISLVSLGRASDAGQLAWAESMLAKCVSHFEYTSLDEPLEWMEDNRRAYTNTSRVLVQLAQSFGADLIHSNQFCFGALPLGLPKIITAHSDVLSWADACRGGALERTPWLDQYISLVRAGLDGSTAVVAPTRWMLAALGKHFALAPETRVIANGRTIPAAVQNRPKKQQAITAGRVWDEAKNIRVLASARSPVPIFVAGDAEFEGSRPSSVFPENVRLLGALGQDRVLQLFSESAVYICTSKYEPFGLAALEAGLAGCAVLAHDVESLREVWGEGAIFFSGPDDLSEILGRLASDREMLTAAQERSLARATIYTADRMVDAYHQLYADVLKHREALDHVA